MFLLLLPLLLLLVLQQLLLLLLLSVFGIYFRQVFFLAFKILHLFSYAGDHRYIYSSFFRNDKRPSAAVVEALYSQQEAPRALVCVLAGTRLGLSIPSSTTNSQSAHTRVIQNHTDTLGASSQLAAGWLYRAGPQIFFFCGLSHRH